MVQENLFSPVFCFRGCTTTAAVMTTFTHFYASIASKISFALDAISPLNTDPATNTFAPFFFFQMKKFYLERLGAIKGTNKSKPNASPKSHILKILKVV